MNKTSLNKAIKNHAMWHQKEADEVLTPSYEFGDQAYCIGTIDQLWYSSDKWEENGNFCTYYHDFDSHPPVYCSEDSPLIVPAAEYLRHKKTTALLRVKSVNGEVPLTFLSYALELTVNYGKVKKRYRFRSEQPPVCGTPDNKTLVILAKAGPIYVRGGRMSITARGIVN